MSFIRHRNFKAMLNFNFLWANDRFFIQNILNINSKLFCSFAYEERNFSWQIFILIFNNDPPHSNVRITTSFRLGYVILLTKPVEGRHHLQLRRRPVPQNHTCSDWLSCRWRDRATGYRSHRNTWRLHVTSV